MSNDGFKAIAGGVLLVVFLVVSPLYVHTTKETVTIRVTDKERIVKRSGDNVSSKYLIFTEGEVFENTDSIWVWKWDSSDVQGALREGETYRVMVYGWRVPFLSWYRNIISVEQAGIAGGEDA